MKNETENKFGQNSQKDVKCNISTKNNQISPKSLENQKSQILELKLKIPKNISQNTSK